MSLILLICTEGAVKSITPESLANAKFPTLSLTCASTVKSPSGKGVPTSTLQLPSAWVTAVNVCICPALSVTVIVT